MPEKIVKSKKEWLRELSPDQYSVCRNKATEPPFSGEYNNCREDGIYLCSCCGNPLFDSATKFDSGTGWPSFWTPIGDDAVAAEEDESMLKRRTEVLCAACDAHLGHVFDDGPQPTGLRYCMNSVALKLAKR